MAQVNANGEEGNRNDRGAAQQPGQQPGLVPNGAAAVARPDAAHVVVVVANPIIANLAVAGALAPPGLLMHPQLQFDVEAALLGPPATKSNPSFDILPIIQ